MDYANPKPDYTDHSVKPDYAEMLQYGTKGILNWNHLMTIGVEQLLGVLIHGIFFNFIGSPLSYICNYQFNKPQTCHARGLYGITTL